VTQLDLADTHSWKHKIALSLIPGIGPVLARNLVSYCGSVEEIFRKKKGQLERIPGIGEERAAMITSADVFDRAERELDFIRKHSIVPLFYLDPEYPRRLRNCDDSPVLMYYKGTADLNVPRMIAIVGTRRITEYGKEMTDQLIQELEKHRVTIVSGLAYGIDIQAHRAALKNNIPTIGVTAHGLDRIYPPAHRPAAEKMIRHGGILTEYPSRTIPDRENFPARNRIVAGMCDATIVIESARQGGALITADLANGYNRDVFALPGRVTDSYSQGCHELIRENKAMLISSGADVATAMNWDVETENSEKKIQAQIVLFNELKPEEKLLAEILQKNGQTDIDTLSLMARLPVSFVSSLLLNMEFSGMVKMVPGKLFSLI